MLKTFNTIICLLDVAGLGINEEAQSRFGKLGSIAAQLLKPNGELPMTGDSLQNINSRPFLTSNIIGATNMQQLKNNIASAALTLNDDVLDGIEQIHVQHPNPSP